MIIKDIALIKQIASGNESERWELGEKIRSIDDHEKLLEFTRDKLVLLKEEIPCIECGNCCRENIPLFSKADISRISAAADKEEEDMIEQHFIWHETYGVYVMNSVPCPFQKGNLCSVYEGRSDGCRAYPEFTAFEHLLSIGNIIKNYSVCPIIFNLYELIADELDGI